MLDFEVEDFVCVSSFSVRVERARAPLRRGWVSRVSGSSRQDLPAVRHLIGTPLVFFLSSTAAVISV